MPTSEIKPVLIVGAGPTGMTAATELARFGVPVRLVEKKTKPETTSRAIGVQARTLELFEQRGLADEMVSMGNKGLAASVYGGGKRVFQLEFSHVDSRYDYILFISQAETERVLRERLGQQGVAIDWGVEMIAFAQGESHDRPGQAGGVTATLRRPDGSLEALGASYLVSAEGAHSTARSTLGLEFKGKSLAEDYALGDFYLDGDLSDDNLHVFSSEHGFMGLFPMGNHHFRMIASNPLSKPSKDTAPSLEELQKMYDMRSTIPVRLRDLSWSSWFRINSRMIERLRVGHVFLGGDSAHIHSPAGAQGMNTGIQDMINLAWKLAFVLHGKASSTLLDTYGEDRLPAIRDVLTKTEGLTGAIGSENMVFRSIFNHVASLVVGTEFLQEKSTTRMSQVALNYRGSPLSETHEHHGDLRAGDRLPDVLLRVMNKPGSSETDGPREMRLFCLLDPTKFTLLYVNDDNSVESQSEFQSSLGPWLEFVSLHQIAPPEADAAAGKHFTDRFGSSPVLILVRPDSYLGLTCGAGEITKVVAYLRKWFPQEKEPAAGDHGLIGHPGDYDAKS
ncbi:MAG TPA: FAD-dependent monooxygenase [Chthoniobacterales bacterium]